MQNMKSASPSVSQLQHLLAMRDRQQQLLAAAAARQRATNSPLRATNSPTATPASSQSRASPTLTGPQPSTETSNTPLPFGKDSNTGSQSGKNSQTGPKPQEASWFLRSFVQAVMQNGNEKGGERPSTASIYASLVNGNSTSSRSLPNSPQAKQRGTLSNREASTRSPLRIPKIDIGLEAVTPAKRIRMDLARTGEETRPPMMQQMLSTNGRAPTDMWDYPIDMSLTKSAIIKQEPFETCSLPSLGSPFRGGMSPASMSAQYQIPFLDPMISSPISLRNPSPSGSYVSSVSPSPAVPVRASIGSLDTVTRASLGSPDTVTRASLGSPDTVSRSLDLTCTESPDHGSATESGIFDMSSARGESDSDLPCSSGSDRKRAFPGEDSTDAPTRKCNGSFAPRKMLMARSRRMHRTSSVESGSSIDSTGCSGISTNPRSNCTGSPIPSPDHTTLANEMSTQCSLLLPIENLPHSSSSSSLSPGHTPQGSPCSPSSQQGIVNTAALSEHTLCPHCNIQFGDEVLHSIHMGCHNLTDAFVCNLCGKECMNKYGFYTHIMRGHSSWSWEGITPNVSTRWSKYRYQITQVPTAVSWANECIQCDTHH